MKELSIQKSTIKSVVDTIGTKAVSKANTFKDTFTIITTNIQVILSLSNFAKDKMIEVSKIGVVTDLILDGFEDKLSKEDFQLAFKLMLNGTLKPPFDRIDHFYFIERLNEYLVYKKKELETINDYATLQQKQRESEDLERRNTILDYAKKNKLEFADAEYCVGFILASKYNPDYSKHLSLDSSYEQVQKYIKENFNKEKILEDIKKIGKQNE